MVEKAVKTIVMLWESCSLRSNEEINRGHLILLSGFSSQESGWTEQGQNIRNEGLKEGSSLCCVDWVEFHVM